MAAMSRIISATGSWPISAGRGRRRARRRRPSVPGSMRLRREGDCLFRVRLGRAAGTAGDAEEGVGGEGQVVLLSGEAGIGKSRIVRQLHEQLAGTAHTRVRMQCSPSHTASALYPVIRHLEHAASFLPDDEPETRLDKLEALL